jgi:phosphoenolpyruvate-protein phosphotransferase
MAAISPTISPPAPAEQTLSGRSIAPGLAAGKAWVVGDLLKSSAPAAAIGQNDVDRELLRLSRSFAEVLAELDQHSKRIEAEFDSALAGIFRAHGDMLKELFASGEFEREMRASLTTAEAVVRRVLRRWYKKFEAIENQTFRQRADDVLDLGRNIIRRLRGEGESNLKSIPEKSILVVERLLPSDVVLLPKSNVLAIVVESLGQGSHAALLAREKGIPTIAELPSILSLVTSGTDLLVDAVHGTLVIAPKESTEIGFRQRLEKWRAGLVNCKSACRDPAKTLDGRLIEVQANIGIHDDVELALDNGADGVGLLRIEQVYFARPSPPTEDELYRELKSLVAPLSPRTVTIRLLDIGGDKPLPYLGLPPASNPVLGLRGVRLLLNYAQLVRTQIGALLRLAQEHSIHVLVPMVTLETDIRQMRDIFDAACAERKIPTPPKFGAMVETPAAALAVPALAKHVEFFCVGTNDLTQYTLAAARDDASVNDYYQDDHESIMRLLKIIAADAADRPITICGELAGRESHVPTLLMMGYRALSIAPNMIPTTKALIRKLDLAARRTAPAG